MKPSSALLLSITGLLMNINAQEQTRWVPAHVSNTFVFTIGAPMEVAAPLFGPEGERRWAGSHWDPAFLHPTPAEDVQGAVFTVQQGKQKIVWVNTVFELSAGRMQYVSFISEVLVSVIDVQLRAAGPHASTATVTYTRTALSPRSNETVQELAQQDSVSGGHWQQAIEECLRRTAKNR